ncbi:MAG: hypothetical protein HYX66_04160 [Ignavibacteria bacterium]|nr:hypothetical protein [Ignavibacteria bacterium]
MAWRVLRELRQASSREEAAYKLSVEVLDAQANLTADMDDCSLKGELSREMHYGKPISYWLSERNNLFVLLNDKRGYVELDSPLKDFVSTLVTQNQASAKTYSDVVLFCQIFETWIEDSVRNEILDRVAGYVESNEKLRALLPTINEYAINQVGSENSLIENWPRQHARHKYFAPSLIYVLFDMSTDPSKISTCFDPIKWKENRDIVLEKLTLGDLTFMRNVPSAIVGSILEKFGFYQIVSQHFVRLLTLQQAAFRANKIEQPDFATTESNLRTVDEFGEWLYEALHTHGRVGANSKIDLIKLCSKTELRLSLKAPSGNYWASKIAEAIAFKLGVDPFQIKLINHGKKVNDESRKRSLKRGTVSGNVQMETLLSMISAIELAYT